MRISITPRAALVTLLGLPVLVLWPAWWTVLLLAAAWLLVVLIDAFLDDPGCFNSYNNEL